MKVRQLIYHILFWLVIMVSFAVSEWGHGQTFKDALIFEMLYLPSRIVAVYLNWFLLIPRILYRNKFGLYFLILLSLLVTIAIAHRYFVLFWGYPMFFPQWMDLQSITIFNLPRLVQDVLIIISPVTFTTGFKLFMDWFHQRQETEALKQEKKEAELKFLKAQTNPHFLFNTLNSIYGLALEKSEKTPSLILKLSDILNYTLYESGAAKVPLRKEIKLIENILALEKERFDKRVDINFIVKGNTDKLEIPPLILIPLVENAFKHGVKNEDKKGWIAISILVEDNHFMFEIENSIPESSYQSEEGGLGLKNVSRRLVLIYADAHTLTIERRGSRFLVKLLINHKTTI